jgi:hypothetical protein
MLVWKFTNLFYGRKKQLTILNTISKMTTNKKISTSKLLFFLFSFLIVTIFRNIGLIFIALIIFYIVLQGLAANNKSIYINKEDANIILLFYITPYIFLAISIASIILYGIPYIEFYPSRFGRMINVSIYFLVFVFMIDCKNRKKISTDTAIRFYLYGNYILLIFGIWQLLNNLFDVPYFKFKTRAYIHSIDTNSLLPFLKIRITSIAEEPAYLIPYLMDAIIILFYTPYQIKNTQKEKPLLLLFITILFFTLSLSGYINFLTICFIVFIFSNRINKITSLIIITPVLVYISYKLQSVFLVVFSRLDLNILLQSGRLQESILPIKYLFSHGSPFNILFGYGPKGLVYICNFIFYTYGYRKGEMLDAESHILFIDHLIEHGVIGLIITIILFYYLYLIGEKTYLITKNRFSQILCLNLIITSLYTSDYASPRFTIIVLLILFCYKDAKNRKIVYEKSASY